VIQPLLLNHFSGGKGKTVETVRLDSCSLITGLKPGVNKKAKSKAF